MKPDFDARGRIAARHGAADRNARRKRCRGTGAARLSCGPPTAGDQTETRSAGMSTCGEPSLVMGHVCERRAGTRVDALDNVVQRRSTVAHGLVVPVMADRHVTLATRPGRKRPGTNSRTARHRPGPSSPSSLRRRSPRPPAPCRRGSFRRRRDWRPARRRPPSDERVVPTGQPRSAITCSGLTFAGQHAFDHLPGQLVESCPHPPA